MMRKRFNELKVIKVGGTGTGTPAAQKVKWALGKGMVAKLHLIRVQFDETLLSANEWMRWALYTKSEADDLPAGIEVNEIAEDSAFVAGGVIQYHFDTDGAAMGVLVDNFVVPPESDFIFVRPCQIVTEGSSTHKWGAWLYYTLLSIDTIDLTQFMVKTHH